MKFSIVIPCYNEAHVLERCLTSITRNRLQRSDVQVIVVDNGSTDDSAQIARRFACEPQDQVICTPRLRISAVRNAGARAASGQYLLFLDSDMLVPDNWLQVLEARFEATVADVLGFVDLPPPEAPWFARIWGERVLGRRHTSVEVDYLPGRNQNMSRKWFEQVGGFNENLTTGEDKNLIMRLKQAGARVVSDRGVDLIHLGYERSLREWVRKEFWRQHSHLDLLKDQGLSLRLLRFPILALGHLIWTLTMLFTLWCAPIHVLWMGVAWFVPSALMAGKIPDARTNLKSFLQFTALYWMRFHVAGVSILHAAWKTLSSTRKV
jgi:glycosyltransferase involved in cell wall biosynthesis